MGDHIRPRFEPQRTIYDALVAEHKHRKDQSDVHICEEPNR